MIEHRDLNLNGAFSSKIRLQISLPFETVSLCHQAGASDISHKFLFQDWTLCDQVLEILELSACRSLFARRMCISSCFAPRDQFFTDHTGRQAKKERERFVPSASFFRSRRY